MALTDPQSITIDGTTFTLARLTPTAGRTEYVNPDGTVKLVILQSNGKRKRSAIRIEFTKVAADPLTAVNSYVTSSIYLMVDRPQIGFSSEDLVDYTTGLITLISGSSYALLSRVTAGES